MDLNEVREWKIETFGERLFQALSMTSEEWRTHRNKQGIDDTGPHVSGQKVDLHFKCAVKPLGSLRVWKERDLCVPAEPWGLLWWWAVVHWALAFCLVLQTLCFTYSSQQLCEKGRLDLILVITTSDVERWFSSTTFTQLPK